MIKPSALEGERTEKQQGQAPKPHGKRHKAAELEVHESVMVPPAETIPPNSRF